jgi:Family of unknown function (DUF6455)
MEWFRRRRVERQAVRMHEMLDRLDVDPGMPIRLKNGDAYAGARATCLFCGTSDKCLRWLDGQDRPDQHPDSCPNLQVFLACKKMRLAA